MNPLKHRCYSASTDVNVQRFILYLNPTEAEDLRAEISRILKQSRKPTKNLTKDEFKAIRELKLDREHIILTADNDNGSSSYG